MRINCEYVYDVIKSCDLFSSPYNFDYKKKTTFQTFSGGILFLILATIFFIFTALNVGAILDKSSLSIIYYTMKYSTTDSISFLNYTSSFAAGLSCGSMFTQDVIDDMIKLKVNYVTMTKKDGIYYKDRRTLDLNKCTYSVFYNEFNDQFDSIGLSEYFCPKFENDHFMSGIYSNDIFNYYEIILEANEADYDYHDISKLLRTEECNFNMYWIDVAVDSYNYKNPIRRFIDGNFVVLKGDEIIKMNIYFKLREFNSDDNILLSFKKPKHFIGYDYFEEYSVFKSENRFIEKQDGYSTLAKVYLRSSLYKDIIERKYLKLTEFIANMTSIFSSVFVFCKIIFGTLNRFKSRQDLIKSLFEFKEKYHMGENNINQNIKHFITSQDSTTSAKKIMKVRKSQIFSHIEPLNEFRSKEILEQSLEGIKCKAKKSKKDNKEFLNYKYSNVAPVHLSQSYVYNANNSYQAIQVETKEDIKKVKSIRKQLGRMNRILNVDLDMTITYFIGNYIKCCVSKSTRFEARKMMIIRNFVSSQLDVIKYFQVIQRIDLLAKVLFSKNKNIFNFLCNNNVVVNNQIKQLNFVNETKNENTKKKVTEFLMNLSQFQKQQKNLIENELFRETIEQLNNF